MEKRGSSPLRGVIIALAALTVIAGAFVLEGILARETGGQWPWFGATPASPAPARVTCLERFTRCGDVATTVQEVPREQLSGFIAGLSPGWSAKESAEGDVEARKDTDGYCPEHRDYRFIALYSLVPTEPPVVCVFRGKKADPKYLIRQVRDLTEAGLPLRDRDQLRLGMPVGPGFTDPFPDGTDVDQVVATFLEGLTR